jgi:hypothetical protein
MTTALGDVRWAKSWALLAHRWFVARRGSGGDRLGTRQQKQAAERLQRTTPFWFAFPAFDHNRLGQPHKGRRPTAPGFSPLAALAVKTRAVPCCFPAHRRLVSVLPEGKQKRAASGRPQLRKVNHD